MASHEQYRTGPTQMIFLILGIISMYWEKKRVKGIMNSVIDNRNICENYIRKKRIDKF